MKKRMIIMLVLSGVVLGGVFGMKWFGNKMVNDYLDAMPTPPVTIASGEAQAMTWKQYLQAVGDVVAVHGADITTEVDGIVTALHFESGDEVERGAPLVDLNAAVEQGELKRLEAQAKLAELNRERQKKLFDNGTLSRSQYDAILAETRAANAAVEAQRGRLAMKHIRAPFAGRLGIRRVTEGQYVGVGTVIATLQSLTPVNVDFHLPERYLGAVEKGLQVEISVTARPGETFRGEILAVEPAVDRDTRNFHVRARLPNTDLVLRPGQSAKVRLTLPEQKQVTVVPRTAIHYTAYGSSVYIIRERESDEQNAGDESDQPALEVLQRFVETGDARGDYIEITSGLEAGEEIAVSGLLKLRSRQPVEINNEVKPQPSLNPRPTAG